MRGEIIEVSELVSKSFVKIKANENEVIFYNGKGDIYILSHNQSCCETVYLAEIIGELTDLVNSPILMAEESEGEGKALDEYVKSYTWTFYKFATVKGYVTLRWYGSSNGQYSEKADLKYYEKGEKQLKI